VSAKAASAMHEVHAVAPTAATPKRIMICIAGILMIGAICTIGAQCGSTLPATWLHVACLAVLSVAIQMLISESSLRFRMINEALYCLLAADKPHY
jgi:hypothetical protein